MSNSHCLDQCWQHLWHILTNIYDVIWQQIKLPGLVAYMRRPPQPSVGMHYRMSLNQHQANDDLQSIRIHCIAFIKDAAKITGKMFLKSSSAEWSPSLPKPGMMSLDYNGLWRHSACRQGTTHVKPEQNGRHFPDDIFICIFLDGRFCILIQMSVKLVSKSAIENKSALV